MLALQEELASTENKVAFARQAFNDAVLSYNNSCQSFPSNLIANNFSFKQAGFLEIESQEKRAVEKSRSADRARPLRGGLLRAPEATRRTSRVLVGLFLLSFAIVAIATTAVVTIALRFYGNELVLGTATWGDWVAGHFGLVAAIALGTFALMGFASLGRAASLAGGGSHVARMLGATQVTGDGSDPLQRRLLNVVEEMALASGVPVPEVYVLEQEAGINASPRARPPRTRDRRHARRAGAVERAELRA
jgi:hypothetical protein